MKNVEETLDILECNPAMISRYLKDGRLILEPNVYERKKYFTDESVEELKISRDQKKISRDQKKKEKKVIVKKLQKEKNQSFELNEVGKTIFSDTVQELKMLGLYRENDNYAILDYAMFYQISIIQNVKTANNVTYWDSKGVQRISADMTVSLSLSRTLDDKRKRLGLDPSGRSKLPVKEAKEMDEMASLMNG